MVMYVSLYYVIYLYIIMFPLQKLCSINVGNKEVIFVLVKVCIKQTVIE